MRFERLQPVEQDGVTPALNRIPVNLEHIALVLPGNTLGHTMLVMAGGMQLMVNHTQAEIMSMIEDRQVVTINGTPPDLSED